MQKYTWFKGGLHEAASRIDRMLITADWDDSFNNMKQIPLQRITSDHTPIALQGASWEKKGIVTLNLKIGGWMKALKNKLKEWSKSEQGNLGSQRNTLLRNLAALETIAGIRMLTHEETTNKGELLLEYEHLIKKEEISWRQRSRALWLKEGDRYTKFFHKVPDVNKKYNSIDQLCVKEK
ncbi:uncharacterized protein [Solanum lycopersicum]|uniref:uncharacterized protein n=1 Tax=Solanum lycopersicum TaxID=4081 RepID=UPI000532F1E0|nr:uncharacterized protein LOC104649708 [Solanum lycopersicum]